jgi:hypothetical protein
MHSNLTIEEQERLAYVAGRPEAALLAQLDDNEQELLRLDEVEDNLAHLESKTENYDDYVDFFEACFHKLAAHYPAPDVTSDYDQSVIFNAIRLGEAARDLLERIADSDTNFADEAKATLAGDN